MKVGHTARPREFDPSGREANSQPDWKAAPSKASRSGKWAITMTKWLITKAKGKTTWQLVTFCGPKGGESVGIVDLVAIRKNHNRTTNGLKRGDLFEIMLIQVKGGKSAGPPRMKSSDCDESDSTTEPKRSCSLNGRRENSRPSIV